MKEGELPQKSSLALLAKSTRDLYRLSEEADKKGNASMAIALTAIANTLEAEHYGIIKKFTEDGTS